MHDILKEQAYPDIRVKGGSEVKTNLTKQHIWESFYALSATVPFDKLTVERIIAHSGVSKATFYRYFRDKYDVLNYNSLAIAERLIGWRRCKDWQEFLLLMFREIAREIDYYRRAFKTSGQNAHSRFLYEYSFSIVKECYLTTCNRQTLTAQETFMISHYCHGCVDTLEEWLSDPSQIPAESMAELFYQAMPECLRNTWIAF